METGFHATSGGIRVAVSVFYLEDQSKPAASEFMWAYRITITNNGPVTVQLLKRTWKITDARGLVQIVHGDGVVGEQPTFEPGDAYEYTSGVPLSTPSGFMAGQYHMIRAATGEPFDVAIPTFFLDSPHQDIRLH